MPFCIKDPKSTYKGSEPSPKGLGYCAHAEKVGTKMKGKDGNIWIIKSIGTNIKRWVKISNKSDKVKQVQRKGKKYYIHDNGGRPFEVIINSKKEVFVYKRSQKDVKNNDYEAYDKLPYDVFIVKFKPKKIHIGKYDGTFGLGNSILLDMGKNKYVCITESIFEFTLENGDEFVKYFSMIGNSDVPYPVLLGKNYFYSMVEKTRGSRSYFPEDYKINDYLDGHTFYFGTWTKKGWKTEVKDIKKLKGLKIIEERYY